MVFPAYVLFIFGMAAFLIAVCAIYYRIYKRRINMALEGETGRHRPMPPPFRVAAALTILFLLFGILMSFVIGLGVGHPRDGDGQIDVNAFYAEVEAVSGETITVRGLPINDEAYRGTFTFHLYKGLMIEWHQQPIPLSDLDRGDLVSIVLLTDVTGFEDIFKIQLLDDEK